jgi:uncharacterized protein YciI
VELESFAFVLLRSRPNAAGFSETERERLQVGHLAHLEAMAAAGKLAGGGPFGDRFDESLRGICFYRCSLQEARTLAEQDPSVQAGSMRVDVMTWWTKKGSVTFNR